MNFVIKTHKQPTRQKQVADVSHVDLSNVTISDNVIAKVADINKKDLFNNKPIEKSNLLMNVTDLFDTTTGEKIFSCEPVYAESYYIDSEGDIVKTAYINGVKCVLVELCDKSLAEIEALCNLNITDDTNVRNSSGVTRVRVNIPTTDVDICKVSLGTYRNYIQYNEKFIALNTKQKRVTYQDSRNKTVYESVIYCAPENKDAIISLIKQLNKSVIEWY
jgi:hypothetical protein